MLNRKARSVCFLLALLLCVSALYGCNADTQTDFAQGAYVFTDDAGYEVRLEKYPVTTAVLFSSYAEIWTLCEGSVDITVYESIERGFASEDALLVDDGAGKTIDTERLIAAQPDFVIASADIPAQVECCAQLREMGIPAALFHVESFADYLRVLDILTTITGNREVYEQYGISVQDAIDGLLTPQIKQQNSTLTYLFIRAGSSKSSTKAKTASNNFVCAMLDDLGAKNIADQAPVLLDSLSFETVLLQDPDFIFISTMGNEQAAKQYMDQVLQQDTWQSLSAIQKGNYAYLEKDLFQFKPNQRWAQAYQILEQYLCQCR